jgi:hypothetical protein
MQVREEYREREREREKREREKRERDRRERETEPLFWDCIDELLFLMRGEREEERGEIFFCFILLSFANFLADFCRGYLSSGKLQEQWRELESSL